MLNGFIGGDVLEVELAQKQKKLASLFVAGFIGSPSMSFAPATIGSDGNSVDLRGGMSFDLPAGVYAAHANREVVLGIRPEDLKLVDNGSGNRKLSVRLVEQLGADTLVHGHFGEDQTDMTLRLAGTRSFQMDEVLEIDVEPEKVHLFDPQTEKRLE